MKIEFDLEHIYDAARDLLSLFPGKRIFAFYGEMGAGKTTFIQALCRNMQVDENVTSPTFALVNEYRDRSRQKTIFHFDFYRIESAEEAMDMGYEDYFFSDAICLIEWPEKIAGLLPPGTLRIKIEVLESGLRRLKKL
jgi:tRNA threonylcarbamoyladenosine biosynthesis protein TsaE